MRRHLSLLIAAQPKIISLPDAYGGKHAVRCPLGEKDRVHKGICVSAHSRLARHYLHQHGAYVPIYIGPCINSTSVGIISSPVDGLVLVPNKREKRTDKEVDQNRAMNTE
jgi:hypothetical protein